MAVTSADRKFFAANGSVREQAGLAHWVGTVTYQIQADGRILILVPNRKIDPKSEGALYESPTVNFYDGDFGMKEEIPKDLPPWYLWQISGETLKMYAGESLWDAFVRCVVEEAGAAGMEGVTLRDLSFKSFDETDFCRREVPFVVGDKIYTQSFGSSMVHFYTTYPEGNAPNMWMGPVAFAELDSSVKLRQPDPNDSEVTERRWAEAKALLKELKDASETFFGLHWSPLYDMTNLLVGHYYSD